MKGDIVINPFTRMLARDLGDGGATFFTDPLYHLTAYGIQNPMVQEAIRLGAYDELSCYSCLGKRTLGGFDEDGQPIPCGRCHGTGFREQMPVCKQDMGDEFSERMARRLGVAVDQRRQMR